MIFLNHQQQEVWDFQKMIQNPEMSPAKLRRVESIYSRNGDFIDLNSRNVHCLYIYIYISDHISI